MFGNDTNQIGLSILRIRIDPGGQSKWGTELGNAQLAYSLGAFSRVPGRLQLR